jgi:nickel/cobalt transporter (NicO) family protein
MSDIQRWLYQSIAAGMGEASGIFSLLSVLAIAMAFGSVHALMPGHGKSVLVSYHLGSETRTSEGLLNGILLVLTHVGSAVILVLAGIAVIRATLGQNRQTAALEVSSAVLVIAIGFWLLWKALKPHRHGETARGPALSIVTGMVPCPLTTFIMTYSVVNGIVAFGLVVVLAMATGMVVTIAGFAIGAVLARRRLASFLARSEIARLRLGQALETFGAVGVIGIGMFGLISRLPG